MLQERRPKLVDSNVNESRGHGGRWGIMATVTAVLGMLPASLIRTLRAAVAKTQAATPAGPPAAAKAGAELKAARERLGLSLPDVAQWLCIRQPHLDALEAGRISELPGNAYVLAFVRTYAEALGLDAREMVRRFKTEAAGVGRPTELVFPVPMPERGLPAGAVLLLGVILAIGTYSGWYRLSGEGRLPAETVTAVPERLASLAEQALPAAAPAPQTAQVAEIPAQPMPADPATPPDGSPPPLPAEPVMAISPTSAAAAQLPPRAAEPASGVGLPVASAGPTDASPRIVLRATADAWLLVKDRSGVTLLNRTLKAGETWPVPVRPDLLLTTGNAGGTELAVDGVTTASLGASGAVRRDLPLDPDQLRLAGAAAQQSVSARARQ